MHPLHTLNDFSNFPWYQVLTFQFSKKYIFFLRYPHHFSSLLLYIYLSLEISITKQAHGILWNTKETSNGWSICRTLWLYILIISYSQLCSERWDVTILALRHKSYYTCLNMHQQILKNKHTHNPKCFNKHLDSYRWKGTSQSQETWSYMRVE